ncbi:hypothetical protein [Acidithiobacillus ferrooxidans]|uniref:Uncharacterized protein n=1 Tax=Acidithiobacillus ferrooxidans TaxID=920 RepID=A0A2W1KJ87_ACIFR|nr:hypothetical protein [Acidithiobacillus ferrooxidans]MCR1344046.1 hypothetical protein [Acidithiobacillus ferrooxidans]PZD82422.1 hypothetical protein DN052_05235 [Acidithiobacillus ferrooxidans]QLK41304.1 hypothetical protein FE661_03330 [Acidithiobacillus ferrooxidans]QZT53246.1 hypothetical protein K7B00_03330 [Acidithiobacillus ferrooxidans]BDB13341.1 hypothetical protein ANFP_06610 [Acidithiobacillus ferrooxidans]
MKLTNTPKTIARGPEIRKFMGEPVYAFLLDDTGQLYDFDRCLTESLYSDDLSFLEALSLLGDDEIFTMPGIVYKRAPIDEP